MQLLILELYHFKTFLILSVAGWLYYSPFVCKYKVRPFTHIVNKQTINFLDLKIYK